MVVIWKWEAQEMWQPTYNQDLTENGEKFSSTSEGQNQELHTKPCADDII
jgi:hypothetical protein